MEKWKRKCNSLTVLLMAEVLLIIALLPGCFRKEEIVDAFGYDGMMEVDMQEGHAVFCSSRITLTPGVYQVRVHTDPEGGQGMYVEMKYDNAYFRALRSNGRTLAAGEGYGEFNVYVLDKVSSAYIQCDFTGTEPYAPVQLEVWRTALGNRMLFLAVLAGSVVVYALAVFRRNILEGKVGVRQQLVFWVSAAGVLLAYFPYLTDYLILGGDTMHQLECIAFLTDALRDGAAFPVGNLFLYFPALLQLAGFSVMAAYKIFVFCMTAAGAAFACLAFKKCFKDEYAALLGGMVYLLSPCHIYTMYNRGDTGVYLAMSFLPIVCCGIYLLYTKDTDVVEYRTYKWHLVWGMCCILHSDLLWAQTVMALLALAGVVFWKKTFRRQTFIQLLEAAGMVLLLSAWRWAPYLYSKGSEVQSLQEAGQIPYKGILWEIFPRLDSCCIALAAVSAAMFASYFLLRAREKGSMYGIASVVIAAAVIVFSAVYQADSIVFEADPIWLYHVEYTNSMSVFTGSFWGLRAAEAVSLASLAAIVGIHFIKKGKKSKDEKGSAGVQ